MILRVADSIDVGVPCPPIVKTPGILISSATEWIRSLSGYKFISTKPCGSTFMTGFNGY